MERWSRGESVVAVTAFTLVLGVLVLLVIPMSVLQEFPNSNNALLEAAASPSCTTTARAHPIRLADPSDPTLPLLPRVAAVPAARLATRPLRHAVDTTSTIFVSVPAFRDPETPHTLLSIFAAAAVPSRVVAGVCEQWRDPDVPVLEAAEALFPPRLAPLLRTNVRFHRMPAAEAKGPVLARSLIERKLYGGEDFLFMVDSHMQFAPRWDLQVLDDYASTPLKPAVLTTYPPTYSRDARHESDFSGVPPRLTFHAWEEGSDFPLWGSTAQPADAEVPAPSIAWAAGFSFASAEAVARVPFHHGTLFPHLFFGEEVGMAVRFFTHGVNLYAPTRNVVLTTYERDYRPLFWDEVPQQAKWEDWSRGRMRTMLAMPRGSDGVYGRYGLGRERTVADYIAFSGIDIQNSEATDDAYFGLAASMAT